jgi:hypothetical protein
VAHVEADDDPSGLERLWDPNSNSLGQWYAALNGDVEVLRKGRRFRQLLPGRDRCKNCAAPFDGFAGLLMRLRGRGRYDRNPKFCHF